MINAGDTTKESKEKMIDFSNSIKFKINNDLCLNGSETSIIAEESKLFVMCKEYKHPSWSDSLILQVTEKDHDKIIRDLDSEADLSLLEVTNKLMKVSDFENLPEWDG